jgi:tRNA G18 (ribose-2'-O)-methylase SpoU
MKIKAEVVFQNQIERELNNWNVKDEYKKLNLDELQYLQPKLGFAVAAFNIDKGLNIGTMLRTAVCFGADEFFLIGKKRYDKRSTVGAQNYIKISKLDEKSFKLKLDEAGYYPVFIETGDSEFSAFDIYELTAQKKKLGSPYKPCFIFGSESEGIPAKYIQWGDLVYSIKQKGVLRSLNVSSCTAIILHNYVNRHF